MERTPECGYPSGDTLAVTHCSVLLCWDQCWGLHMGDLIEGHWGTTWVDTGRIPLGLLSGWHPREESTEG